MQRDQHFAPLLAAPGNKKTGWRFIPTQHFQRGIDLVGQPVEAAKQQVAAQDAGDFFNLLEPAVIHAQRLRTQPGCQQQTPQVEPFRLNPVVVLAQHEGGGFDGHIAQPHADGMHPDAPEIERPRFALAGLADAVLTRQFKVFGRGLRDQGERIKPAQAFRKDALARAGFHLAQLDRRLERLLRFQVATLLAKQRGPHRPRRAIVQPVEHAGQARRVAAQQEQFAQRQPCAFRNALHVDAGLQPRLRQIARRRHVQTPEFRGQHERSYQQLPAQLGRDAIEVRGIHALENRLVQQAIPVSRPLLNPLFDRLELGCRHAGHQCNPQQSDRTGLIHPPVKAGVLLGIADKFVQALAQRFGVELVKKKAVKRNSEFVVQPHIAVLAGVIDQQPVSAQFLISVFGVVMHIGASIAALQIQQTQQVVDIGARAPGPEYGHCHRDVEGVGRKRRVLVGHGQE